MKVLLVNGSGHETGCTYTALMEGLLGICLRLAEDREALQ